MMNENFMKLISTYLIFASLSMLVSCNSTEKTFVAKIGDAVLTEASVDSALQSDVRLQAEVRQNYIQNWINSESVYQKALREGFDKNPAYQRQVDNLQHELLIQSYLDNELGKNVSVTSMETEEYYAKNKNSFVYPEDQIKVQYFLTRDKTRSKKIAGEFLTMSRLRKKDFMDLISQTSADSDIVGATDFQPRKRFEEKVAKQIFMKNATDEIIGPIVTKNGYYSFWYVVEIRPNGSFKPLSEASQEIEARLKVLKRKQRTTELIDKIRLEMNVEYGNEEPSLRK